MLYHKRISLCHSTMELPKMLYCWIYVAKFPLSSNNCSIFDRGQHLILLMWAEKIMKPVSVIFWYNPPNNKTHKTSGVYSWYIHTPPVCGGLGWALRIQTGPTTCVFHSPFGAGNSPRVFLLKRLQRCTKAYRNTLVIFRLTLYYICSASTGQIKSWKNPMGGHRKVAWQMVQV